jgi:hypothetical protein
MYNDRVRTTIEMRDKHRAALLDLAARRGEKGFSKLVEEAIEAYLRSPERRRQVRRAKGLKGTLSAREADRLAQAAAKLRASWR